jgi:methyl-accepting chemotaxis protein
MSSILKNVPVIIRIHAITLMALISVISLALISAAQLRGHLEEEAEARTSHLVETAQGIVKHFYDEAEAGHLTKEQAQADALAAVRAMRYDGGNYFFVELASDGTTIAHGGNPALENQKSQALTPTLLKVSKEVLSTAAEHGSGFVRYEVAKPGESEPKPKISYVASFKPWNWVIGTGIFVDNIDARVKEGFMQAIVIGFIMACLVALVAWLLARGIVGPLGRVVTAQDRLIAGDLNFDVKDADRADEIGRIARGVVAAKESAVERRKLEAEAEARRQTDKDELERTAELDRK